MPGKDAKSAVWGAGAKAPALRSEATQVRFPILDTPRCAQTRRRSQWLTFYIPTTAHATRATRVILAGGLTISAPKQVQENGRYSQQSRMRPSHIPGAEDSLSSVA